jgi:hypothetical protein
MRIDDYLAYCRAQGFKTLRTRNAWWRNYPPIGYATAPEHLLARVEDTDLSEMFWKHLIPYLRVIEDAATIRHESELWHRYICRDPDYDLSSLGQKARNQTRRGLERCEVRPISFDFLGREGVRINRGALARQGRAGAPAFCDPDHWVRSMAIQGQFPDVLAFGAFVQELAEPFCAYLTALNVEDEWLIYLQMSNDESLRYYCNNALYFEVLRHLLKEKGAKSVSMGLEPLNPLPKLHHFKISMGFKLEPVRQRFLLHPLLNVFLYESVSRYFLKIIHLLHKLNIFPKYVLEQSQTLMSHLTSNNHKK